MGVGYGWVGPEGLAGEAAERFLYAFALEEVAYCLQWAVVKGWSRNASLVGG